MKRLPLLLIIVAVAAAVAMIVAQRERLRELDRMQITAQIRAAVETRLKRSKTTIDDSGAEVGDDIADRSAAALP